MKGALYEVAKDTRFISGITAYHTDPKCDHCDFDCWCCLCFLQRKRDQRMKKSLKLNEGAKTVGALIIAPFLIVGLVLSGVLAFISWEREQKRSGN